MLGVVTELDPVVFVEFFVDALTGGIHAINNSPNPPVLPAWFVGALVYPITAEQFKVSVMGVSAQVTNGGVIGHSIIGPNTTVEFGRIIARITSLCNDPFVLTLTAAANGSIAKVYAVNEASVRARASAVDITSFGLPAGAIAAFI